MAKKAHSKKGKPKSDMPDLTPNMCLVAFIDILGFGHEIENAKSKEDLERIYEKVRIVQKEFQKESASDDPNDQSEMNSNFGRRVIALSDAVVVVITPKCTASSMMGHYDHLGLAIAELITAQGLCAARHGIFLRGGVSLGSFFFEDDVLLSPALARAYELESKCADYPVIAISEETRDTLLNVPQQGGCAPGWDPTPRYFRRHGSKKWRGKPLYFLDYVPVMLNEVECWSACMEDYEKYIAAREQGDAEEVQKALERRHLRSAANFLKWHRRHIESAYQAANSEKVRKKYRWLMKYHNRSFRNDVEFVKDEVINLSQFSKTIG
ncbi:MAG: hypothetical protein ACK46A_14610 [Akkermansiaceae bacterium]|jgi:hypothetical protein